MKKRIIFKLPAEAVEGATEALLLGDFNDWSSDNAYLLEEQEDGSFKTVVQLEAGRTYQYRFLLNDGRWVNDYNAQNYVPVSGYYVDNCVITVPETLDIEISPKAKTVKKKEKIKTDAEALHDGKKSKKSAAPKAKKAKDASEKTKAKKSEKPVKSKKKDAAKDKN